MTATPLSGVCRHRTDLGVLCRRTGLGDLAFPEGLCQEVNLHAIGLFNDLNAVSQVTNCQRPAAPVASRRR